MLQQRALLDTRSGWPALDTSIEIRNDSLAQWLKLVAERQEQEGDPHQWCVINGGKKISLDYSDLWLRNL